MSAVRAAAALHAAATWPAVEHRSGIVSCSNMQPGTELQRLTRLQPSAVPLRPATSRRSCRPRRRQAAWHTAAVATTGASGGGTGSGTSSSDWIQTSLVRTDPKYNQTKFEVDFLPPSPGTRDTGTVLFLHGFEQVPQDYDTILQRLADGGNWVIAPVQPQFVPLDPLLKELLKEGGSSRAILQEVVHADALQVATLLFDKGTNGEPKLDEVDPKVNIGRLSGQQVAIAGHSLGGGLTWSVVQFFPGRFDKLAVMAPFPNMADDALSPATVIGKPNPATGKPYQPPRQSLVIDGGFDVLALASRITKDILDPLEALRPRPKVTTFKFDFGTHTGYQDFTGIGNVLRIPAGVLIYLPKERTSRLQSNVDGSEQGRRLKLVLGAATNAKVITFPTAVENFLLTAVSINKYAIYIILLVALLAISKVTGALAEHISQPWASLFWLLSAASFLLVPLELFEVLYYTPCVQRPQTTKMVGDFMNK